MKSHKLTGEQAYNWGRHSSLYQRYAGAEMYGRLIFESYEPNGIIIARDENDCAVIFREDRTYTLYTKTNNEK